MSIEIARVDVKRGYRWVRAQDFWVAFTAIMAVVGAFLLWATFDATRAAGAAMADGAERPTWLATGTSVLWAFITALLAAGAAGTDGDLDDGGHYLTMRPVADVAGGTLVAAALKFSVYTLGPGVAAGLGLALGTGSALAAVGVLLAAVLATLTAVAVGYPVGFAAKGVIRRSRGLASATTLLGAALAIAYVVLSVTGGLLTVVEGLRPVLLAPPLAWLSDLALVTTPGSGASLAGAAAALGLGAAVVAAGVVLVTPAARFAWTADVVRPSEDSDASAAPEHRVDALLAAVCRSQGTRAVASTCLLRSVRSPFQFLFVAPPLVGAILLAEGLLATGSLPWFTPWFAVWYGSWIAGAVVPLNPLGTQGAALPALLTAPAGGRRVVHGHVVAATLPMAPVTAGVAVGAGVLAGSSPSELGAIALASVVAVAAGATLAVGIGSVFPRFEAIDFAGGRRAVPPSKIAYGLFSTLLTVLAVSAAVVADDAARRVVAAVLSEWLPFGVELGTGATGLLSWTVLVACLAAVPLAYVTAVRRIGAYGL